MKYQEPGDGWEKLFQTNPFPKESPYYNRWLGELRLLQEKTLKLYGEISQRMPSESDSTAEFQAWFSDLMSAEFEAAARTEEPDCKADPR